MKLLTWNVMHRDYETKYNSNSEILTQYKNEDKRLEKQLEIIKNNLNENTIFCLQECSKDIKKNIEDNISSHGIYSHKLNKNEFILTLAPKDYFIVEHYENKSIRGGLMISNNEHNIFNCHLNPKHIVENEIVLDSIVNLPDNLKTIVCGDFNENYENVNNHLNGYYIIPKNTNTYKKRCIDHIIFDFNASKYNNEVIDCNNTSDHKIVKLEIFN